MNGPQPDRVVVITDFAHERGGASRLALLMARRLAARDIPVTVFAGDLPAMELPAGIAVAGIEGRALLDRGRTAAVVSGMWNGAARGELNRLIDAVDTPGTIYHVHGFLQTLSPAIFAALHPVRRRVVIHAHDYFLACPNGAFFDYRSRSECTRVPLSTSCIGRNCDKRSVLQKAWRLGRQAIQNRLLADIARDGCIILIHEMMRPYLERRSAIGKAVTVRNPAEPFLTAPATPARHANVLYVGDIHAYKGVFELAEAARRAGVPLCFAGTGQDHAELEARYPEATFLGWQDRAGLAHCAAQARAVIVPTLGPEPFGLTIVEALTSGLPVIVSDKALLAREVVASGAGLTFRAGDVDDLAGVLGRVATDDVLVRSMSAAAVRTAGQYGKTPDDWCDEILQVHRAALAQTRIPAAAGQTAS